MVFVGEASFPFLYELLTTLTPPRSFLRMFFRAEACLPLRLGIYRNHPSNKDDNGGPSRRCYLLKFSYRKGPVDKWTSIE